MSVAIFNLKKSVQGGLNITVFKNHLRQKLSIAPINEKAWYGENDKIKWDLKGHNVDYINLKNSYITGQLKFFQDATYAEEVTCELPYSNAGMLHRMELLFGSRPLQDIEYIGILIWMLMLGTSNNNTINPYTGFSTNCDYSVDKSHFGAEGYNFKLPFFTLLDPGKELPVFQLADRLTIRITLSPSAFWISSVDSHKFAKYQLRNPKLVIDGRLATTGGILLGNEFRYHSWDWRSYWNELTKTNRRTTLSFDFKKSSLKRFIGKFMDITSTDSHSGFGFTRSLKNSLEEYYWSMNGKYLPMDYPLRNSTSWYHQLLCFFHEVYNMGYIHNKTVPYEYSPTHENSFLQKCFWPICVFDRLPQNNNVISGLSTERFDIKFHWSNSVDLTQTNFLSFWGNDVIVHWVGGVIDLED